MLGMSTSTATADVDDSATVPLVPRLAEPARHGLDADERLAAMAKALGHPTRVRIVRLLAERDTCVTGELASQLPFAQSTVSEHLRILRAAGLLRTHDDQGRPCNCVDEEGLGTLKDAIASL
jgi:ArsR family transcriptional regulator